VHSRGSVVKISNGSFYAPFEQNMKKIFLKGYHYTSLENWKNIQKINVGIVSTIGEEQLIPIEREMEFSDLFCQRKNRKKVVEIDGVCFKTH